MRLLILDLARLDLIEGFQFYEGLSVSLFAPRFSRRLVVPGQTVKHSQD
jgi:hypothetical protein